MIEFATSHKCHYIKDYYNLRSDWVVKEKKKKDLAACLKVAEAH